MLKENSSITRRFWILAFTAGIFLAVFAAYPQIKLWNNTGADWNGHYAFNDIDEVAYASYLKALIDGRPRKNDPFSGRDDSKENPQPESLFSIQFAAPYAVALPARLLGVGAPWAMTLAGVFSGFLAVFVCFWLIRLYTGNDLLAFSGSLFVFCCGALVAGEGAIGEIMGTGFSYPYFPFLRRYIPAVPFPVFFFMITSVWLMLGSKNLKTRIIWCAAASAAFAFLVFSYFYIWTTALAWLCCVGLVLLVLRPENWKQDVVGLFALGASCLIPLAVYFVMLSNRATSMDNVQLLVTTRLPDLERVPLYIGLVVVVCVSAFAILGKAKPKSLHFVFAVATGIVPFVLFNQQVITGQSLQPIHYQVFIGNYVAGLAVVFGVGILIKSFEVRSEVLTPVLAAVAVAVIAWGFVECHFTVRVLDSANIARDRSFGVAELLKVESAKSNDPYRDTVFVTNSLIADDLPTIAPQNVLWARHQHVFAGLDWEESKERFYLQIYYQDQTPEWLEAELKSRNFVVMIALFGWGRHTTRLSAEATPLTNREIEQEVANYRSFVSGFNSSTADEPELNFLIVPEGQSNPSKNIDRWYEQVLVGISGGQSVYRLKKREKEKTADIQAVSSNSTNN